MGNEMFVVIFKILNFKKYISRDFDFEGKKKRKKDFECYAIFSYFFIDILNLKKKKMLFETCKTKRHVP